MSPSRCPSFPAVCHFDALSLGQRCCMPPVHYQILTGIAATLALISELYQLQEEQNMRVDLSTATLTGGEADNGMVGDQPSPHCQAHPNSCKQASAQKSPLHVQQPGSSGHCCLKREMPIKQMPAQEGLLVQPTRSATTSLPNNSDAVLTVAVFGKATN